MTKFSHEFRVKLVMEVESGLPLRTVAQKYNVSTKTLRTWAYHYRSGGIEQIVAIRGHYTQEFKLSAIEYRRTNDVSYAQAAADLKIPEGRTLCEWEKRYSWQGLDGLLDTRKGRPPKMPRKESKPKKFLTREQELEAEVTRLQMENAYLKKLNALVAEREKSEKKTK